MITVISACYGGYDQPAVPPEQDTPVRWVMVNDGLVDVPAPWVSHVEPRPHMHPRLAAKFPKCLPWLYAGGNEANIAIWLDASATINRPDFASTVAEALGDGDIAQWVHPQRNCIIPEAEVSAGMQKYAGLRVREQAASYTRPGGFENRLTVRPGFGLWATGCMAWRRGSNAGLSLGQSWLFEQVRWTYQDQISWPWLVNMHGLDIRPLPGNLWDRQLVTFRPHASHE